MSTVLEHTPVQTLEDLSEQILKGVSGANLRRMLVPQQMMRLQKALSVGDAQAVSFVMRDVAGEAISLTAGESLGGGEAMQALSDAQAHSFITLRAQGSPLLPSDAPQLLALVRTHRKQLIQWVKTGTTQTPEQIKRHGPDDLTQIGELLAEPVLRQSAISVFVASAAVIEAGLSLFGAPA